MSRRKGKVFQRGATWYTDFSWRGKRYKEAAPDATNESQALDELEVRRVKVREGRRPANEGTTFPGLVEKYRERLEAKGTRGRTLVRWNQVLAHLEAFFGSELGREVPERVDAYVVERRREGAKPGTIKLELGVLASVFKAAKLPKLDLPEIEVRNTRKGFLTAAQVQSLTGHLPEALRPPVWFAFYTGWRKSEVLGLEWRGVDLEAGVVRLEPETTKTDEGREFPAGECPELARLLLEQRELTTALERSTGRIVRNVFHRDGAPIRDMDDAWKTARRAAGLPAKIFHDLRRSAALRLRNLGASESDIMEWCGWATREMFKRYSIKDRKGSALRMRRLSEAPSVPTSSQTADPRS